MRALPDRRLLTIALALVFLLLLAFYYYHSKISIALGTARIFHPPSPSSPTPPLDDPQNETTRALIIASLQSDDVSWALSLPSTTPSLTTHVYTVDNASAPLTVPANKGHEAMVYLTYIIDHYHTLPAVAIFMHAHETTWHKNDFLNSNSSLTVTRLSQGHDRLSGRVREYLWQYVLGGVEEYCPDEFGCYCDGFGVCFGGDRKEYERYFELRGKRREIEGEMAGMKDEEGRVKAGEEERFRGLGERLQPLIQGMEQIKDKAMDIE
ncbi:hypothetical protein AJ79_08130 [Helicocarpus griseus UAMH5409]|uniref:Uncharacterized protein n=1 Tax=Helicocarpus griseus UAMH5409 TaxID=1447875 RepID=A0A2B7WVV2_9EURO|nr:hypothetical protein AJ79_08130 [Helicocarpus griseus UAMH5409]